MSVQLSSPSRGSLCCLFASADAFWTLIFFGFHQKKILICAPPVFEGFYLSTEVELFAFISLVGSHAYQIKTRSVDNLMKIDGVQFDFIQ